MLVQQEANWATGNSDWLLTADCQLPIAVSTWIGYVDGVSKSESVLMPARNEPLPGTPRLAGRSA